MKVIVLASSIIWACSALHVPPQDDRQPWQHRIDIYQPFFHQTHRYRDTRSVKQPALVVDMPLPSPFVNVKAFKEFLGIVERPERRKRDLYQARISKREALIPDSTSKLVENQTPLAKSTDYLRTGDSEVRVFSGPILELAERVRMDQTNDGERDPRKRRNSSINDHEDDRDKRMFADIDIRDARDIRESTTPVPSWKKRKDNGPQFVTTSFPNGPQHRSGEGSARESHSLKDLEKTNEIPRSLQTDNFYSATNRRTSSSTLSNSRTVDLANTPPSAYDSYDYNNSRRGFSRLADDRRIYNDNAYSSYPFSYSRAFTYPRVYDRYWYNPAGGGEIIGRGVEYYHRNVEPATGRVVYYANLPEPNSRSYDPRGGYPYPVYSGYPSAAYDYRGFYPAVTDPYYRGSRNVLPGGSTEQYQTLRGYDNSNRTYIIYDADEKKPFYNGYLRPTYPAYSNQGYSSFTNYNPYRSPWLPGNSSPMNSKERFLPEVQIPLTVRNRDLIEPKKI